MGLRTTAALLVVAAALLAVLWFTNDKPDDGGAVSVPVLGGSQLANATRIRWQFAGEQPVEIQRRPGGPFRIVEPFEDLASLAHLRSIAGAYDRQMSEAPLADDQQNRERLGFDPPQLTVEVDFESGDSQRLEIGSGDALGTGLFVRRNGRIYRAENVLLSALRLSTDDLRERAAFRTPPPLCTEFVVDRALEDGGREALHLARAGVGEWRFLSPIQTRADEGATQELLAQLLGLRIDGFAGGVRSYDRPADLVVTVRGGPEEEVARFWITENQQLLGWLEPRQIWIEVGNNQFVQIFANAVDRLRARVLVDAGNVHRDLVRILVDQGPDRPRLLLSRATADLPWEMIEPVESAVSPTPVQELLTAINNLRAMEFHEGSADEARYGFRSDGLRVGTQRLQDRQPSFVRFGADSRMGEHEVTFAARAESLAEVVSVPKGAVDVIRRPATEYFALQVLDVRQAVERVVLRRRDGTERDYVRDAGEWGLVQGGTAPEDFGDLVDRVRDLRGKRARLVSDLDLGAEPDWTLTLARRNRGDTFVELQVYDRGAAEPLLVRRPGSPIAFELSQTADGDALRKLWQ